MRHYWFHGDIYTPFLWYRRFYGISVFILSVPIHCSATRPIYIFINTTVTFIGTSGHSVQISRILISTSTSTFYDNPSMVMITCRAQHSANRQKNSKKECRWYKQWQDKIIYKAYLQTEVCCLVVMALGQWFKLVQSGCHECCMWQRIP